MKLETIAQRIRDLTVGELIDMLVPAADEERSAFFELTRDHRHYDAARAAIKAGKLPARKVAGIRAMLIAWDDWNAWIASHPTLKAHQREEETPPTNAAQQWLRKLESRGRKAG